MAPIKRSAQEEDAFMSSLLSDDNLWASPTAATTKKAPSPFTTPVRKQKPREKSAKKAPLAALAIETEHLLDGIDDWDDLDISSPVKPSPKKLITKEKTKPETRYRPHIGETCTRCTVMKIEEHKFERHREKRLTVRLSKSDECRSVVLRDDWLHTDARVGDKVNVLGEFTMLSESSSSITGTITITAKDNLLILHPDTLMTATALANAAQCRRKPLLSALVHSSSDVTPALVWGNMLHTILQAALVADRWDEAWMDEKIDETVRGGISDLLSINMSVDQAKHEVKTRAKGLHGFSEKYISDTPKPTADLINTRAMRNSTSQLAITRVLDIEEEIWCPSHGIKGKIDATVDTTIMETNPPLKAVTSKGPKPFEVKTGRAVAVMEHRAQTMLYTILAEKRYGIEVTSGLLYYTQSEEVVQVPIGRNELRGLIIYRNEMAGYMARRHLAGTEESSPAFLPPTLDDERICKRCYSLDTCMLYRKAVEGVVDTDSPIADTYALKTGHLSDTQLAFFKQWEHLIALEESDLGRFRKEIWTMGAADREAKGRCFSAMTIDQTYSTPPAPSSKMHPFTYKFVRASTFTGTASMLSGFLNVGDPVTISVEPKLLALARGYILELSPTHAVLGVDHDLALAPIRSRLSMFIANPGKHDEVVFRIDRDEYFSGMTRIRENLARLFYAEGDSRRLELVVDLRPPVFTTSTPASKALPLNVAKHLVDLNANQKHAVARVLSAQDYALVLGMPGTGKTTVIAALIRSLAAMGKTILLTSYTHSAVDTILLKLRESTGGQFDILRLGKVDKVHPDVRYMTLDAKRTATTVEQLEKQVMTPLIVATTCLSVDHPLFSRRKFDYCIVDEASQITLPTCLGPLRFADKFVLVGDHFQLPPLVRHPEARKGGLDVSLFRRLSDAHPQAVVDLTHQYRMNEDIMLLSNKLIYGDRLRCGSEEVRQRVLRLRDRDFLEGMHDGDMTNCQPEGCWIQKLADESCKAIFVDTDLVPARDSRVGDLVQNEVEAALVTQVAETLLKSGVEPEQIGVISLYRQQLKLLGGLNKGIELLTADRSQGRDKDCIIISMVRSNDDGLIGDLVKDWRRMNVSFTRARSKLIIFGSRKTLKEAPLLKEFFGLMEGQNWILQLPADAHLSHPSVFGAGGLGGCNGSPKRGVDHSGNEDGRPAKKQKALGEEGLLRTRPILRDLVNDDR